VSTGTVTVKLVLTEGMLAQPFGSRFKVGIRTTGFHDLMGAQATALKMHNTFLKPWLFSTVEDEYRSMTEVAVVIDVTGEEVIELRGEGAYALVDRLVPRRLPPVFRARCSYTVMCYPYGGIVEDGIVIPFSDELVWWSGGPAQTEQWLYEHGLGTNVRVSSRLDEVHVLSVQGPESRRLLVDAGCFEAAELGYFGLLAATQVCGVPVTITRTGYTAELGYDLYVERGLAHELGERLLEVGAPLGVRRCGSATLEIRRVEAGILNVGQDFDWRHTPLECGLEWMVAFDKDFVGSAALQAQRAEGPPTALVGLVAEPGVVLVGGDGVLSSLGRVSGIVTSAVASPTLGRHVAIARVMAGSVEQGDRVALEGCDGERRGGAQVCTFPFVDPERLRARA
jgi:aminomethyltransferase